MSTDKQPIPAVAKKLHDIKEMHRERYEKRRKEVADAKEE